MQLKKGTLTTRTAGSSIALAAGMKAIVSLVVAAEESFEGKVVVEESRDAGASWTALRSYTGTSGTPLTGTVLEQWPVLVHPADAKGLVLVRARVDSIAEGSDGISYNCSTWAPEAIVTGPLEVTELSMDVFETKVKTSGSQGSEGAVLGDGVWSGVLPGTRKLVTLATRTHASDKVALDEGDIVGTTGQALAAVTIDAAGGFVLLEFNGTAWQVLYSKSATITNA